MISGVTRIFERSIQFQSNMLRGKFFQMERKGFYFASVSIFSIFLTKNIVISLKKVFTVNLSQFCRFFGFQDVTISNFLLKLTQNAPKTPEWNRKETKRKRTSSKSDGNNGGSGLISQTKIAYNDFLERPNFCL